MAIDNGKNTKGEVIDFRLKREEKLEEKRRKNERVFLRKMLGIFCVTENSGMKSVEIVDISEEGLSFVVPFRAEQPWPSDARNLGIRLYFSEDSYLPLLVNVQNSRPYVEDGVQYVRYGCAVDTTTSAYHTYRDFVRFMQSYAENAYMEHGAVSGFFG